MKVFTYNQYIKCIHALRLNAILQLAEEGAEYHLENQNKKYSHDKLVKSILKDKKEAENFINHFIEPKNYVTEENLIPFTNSYITKKYKSKEADLVYKLKDKEIFFLIEHQSTVDITMPYRMLNYCIDIIQEWSRNKKIGKSVGYPIIVPIVIYTGNQKWKVPNNFSQKQINVYAYEKYKINLEYNLIDINRLSKYTLLELDTMFGYILLIEKSNTKKELVDNLELIIKSIKDKEKIEKLTNIIDYLFKDILQEDIKQELLEKIDKKVGEKDMSTLRDRLLAENKRILNEGKKQGRIEGEKISKIKIVKNMINIKMDDQAIIEITGIDKQELEKLKNEEALVS